ncbi:MAG: hypothetical protein M3131_09820, partial [Actinomycetota bacterium]|nr:hypothetical protein [Actinomycetota bacterium]
MKAHGATPRGLRPLPLSPQFEGRFGRLFRRLPPAPPLDDAQIGELVERMHEPRSGSGGWEGPGAPPDDRDNPA